MLQDYTPGLVPTDPAELPRFLIDEFARIAYLLTIAPARAVEFVDVAPKKPREGMLYGADGINWNPGAGKGIYCYYGGAWTKL